MIKKRSLLCIYILRLEKNEIVEGMRMPKVNEHVQGAILSFNKVQIKDWIHRKSYCEGKSSVECIKLQIDHSTRIEGTEI
jgi:hypothetical protein